MGEQIFSRNAAISLLIIVHKSKRDTEVPLKGRFSLIGLHPCLPFISCTWETPWCKFMEAIYRIKPRVHKIECHKKTTTRSPCGDRDNGEGDALRFPTFQQCIFARPKCRIPANTKLFPSKQPLKWRTLGIDSDYQLFPWSGLKVTGGPIKVSILHISSCPGSPVEIFLISY